MASITESSLEDVKRSASVLDVASEFATFRRAGREHVALCPYPDHNEKTPSFYANPEKNLYLCRGCKRGGDAIKLVEDMLGLEFVEAVEHIAERNGIELEYEGETGDGGGRAKERRARREAALRALDAAAADYHSYLLRSDDGEARGARAYLFEERGIGREVVETFRVGYAPSTASGKGFCRAAKARHGLDREALDAAGLLDRRGDDRFEGRITFPFSDRRSRVVGFGARVLPEAEGGPGGDGERERAKYLNSPESGVFNKRALLYGLGLALPAIRSERRAVVVEGYTDVLMLHQSGIRAAVGIAGTALTAEHLRLLAPHADTVYLVFDPDQAGQRALERAREAAELQLDLRVVALDEDPADWLREHAVEEFVALLRAAPGVVEHEIEHRARAARDADPMTKSREFGPVRKLVAELDDPVLRNEYARRAAADFGVSVEDVLDRKPRPNGSADAREATGARASDPTVRAERYLLAMALRYPEHVAPLLKDGALVEGIEGPVVLTRDDFASGELGTLYEELGERAADGRPFSAANLVADERLREQFGLIAALDGEAEDVDEDVRAAVAREAYLRVAMLSRRHRRAATDDESPEWDRLYGEEISIRDAIANGA